MIALFVLGAVAIAPVAYPQSAAPSKGGTTPAAKTGSAANPSSAEKTADKPAANQIEGIIMDAANSYKAQTRVVPGPRLEGGIIVAEAYTREELLKPENIQSGYGLVTYDGKFLKFDPAGHQKALALIRNSKKLDNFHVFVTGQVTGDTLKVSTIRLAEDGAAQSGANYSGSTNARAAANK